MPKYDEISYWSEVKLEIISKYASAYSTIMSKQGSIRNYIYIDAFAGAGVHIRKQTREFITGSPLNALVIVPAFPEFHFIDLVVIKLRSSVRALATVKTYIFIKGTVIKCFSQRFSRDAGTRIIAEHCVCLILTGLMLAGRCCKRLAK